MNDRANIYGAYGITLLLGWGILILDIYYRCHPLLSSIGLTVQAIDTAVMYIHQRGLMDNPLAIKMAVILLLFVSSLLGNHFLFMREESSLSMTDLLLAGVSIAAMTVSWKNQVIYIAANSVGAGTIYYIGSLIDVGFSGRVHENDLRESFPQQRKEIRSDLGLTLPMKFRYRKRWIGGFINVVNPFRGTLVVGSAGSGKSFSIFNPFIVQFLEKGYTMLLYDYKMPDLTSIVYNEYLRNKDNRDRYKVEPQFYCINFQDPLKSNRCNPLSPEYLSDIIDASETARVVMDALNKGRGGKKDFFEMSAQQYFGVCLWFLRTYTPVGGRQGDWCDFPHLIEFINYDYRKVLDLVKNERDLDSKARMFVDALEAKAQGQLQGQIASVRVPLNDLSSPALYWVFSGNDFSLDINDPKAPKIVCIGNDPDRQQVYGAAISLLAFRVIKRINRDGKLPCAVLLDELPTITVDGLDGLMSTARSRKVAVVLGIQDISQINADYGDVIARKILSLPTNIFVGGCSIDTAEKYSREFGKEFRRQESTNVSDQDKRSVNVSYREEEIMPIRKITSLPRGTFIGKVAIDDHVRRDGKDVKVDIDQPFFCGNINIDTEQWNRRLSLYRPLPQLTHFRRYDGTEITDKDIIDDIILENFYQIKADIASLFE